MKYWQNAHKMKINQKKTRVMIFMANLVKRATTRMIVLKKLSEFGAPISDLRTI